MAETLRALGVLIDGIPEPTTAVQATPTWPTETSATAIIPKLAGAVLRFKAASSLGAQYAAIPLRPTTYQASGLEVGPTFNGRKTQDVAWFDENVEAFMPHLLSPLVDTAGGTAASQGDAEVVMVDGMRFAVPLVEPTSASAA